MQAKAMQANIFSKWRPSDPDKLVLVIALGFCLGYAGAFFSQLSIPVRPGHSVVDFVAFWTAGHLALGGKAISAYNAPLEHAAEVATIGHAFSGSLGWSYPPAFFFIAVVLASLPYSAAFFLWCSTTLAAYAYVVAAIARNPLAFLVACAAPWILPSLMPGQNGLLTAVLVGAALLCLEKRPVIAGLILGLLSYKPQFGILFPLVLAAGGYWRTFAWALMSALTINVLAGAVFGLETLPEFLHALSKTTQSHLSHAGIGWKKLQSCYGLMRSIGAPYQAAWLCQTVFSAAIAFLVCAYWRSNGPFNLKAAILACAILLVTPYIFVYDLPTLAVACAFLYRHRRFDRWEIWLLISTAPSIFAFVYIPLPTALLATIAVGAVAVSRALAENMTFHRIFGVTPIFSIRSR